MKKISVYLLSGLVVMMLSTISFAMKDMKESDGHIKGEVTHVDGDMVTVKDDHEKEHKLHVDKTTKKEGDVHVGAHVEAEATSSGHAKSISVHKEKGH